MPVGERAGDQAGVARHPVEVAAGLGVAGIHHVPGALEGGRKRAHGREFLDHQERNQVAEDVELREGGFGEHVRLAGIEEDEPQKDAVREHRHRVARGVARPAQAPGVFAARLLEREHVLDDARVALVQQLPERGHVVDRHLVVRAAGRRRRSSGRTILRSVVFGS